MVNQRSKDRQVGQEIVHNGWAGEKKGKKQSLRPSITCSTEGRRERRA